MTNVTQISRNIEGVTPLQQAIDLVETLSLDEQDILVTVIQKRLQEKRRQKLVQTVKEAEAEYAQGTVHRGTIADLMAELDS
jgi:small ligand-binding sensory domain FIST